MEEEAQNLTRSVNVFKLSASLQKTAMPAPVTSRPVLTKPATKHAL
jgi:hypothetical protein